MSEDRGGEPGALEVNKPLSALSVKQNCGVNVGWVDGLETIAVVVLDFTSSLDSFSTFQKKPASV
jgi:hypothetical protein